MIFLPSIYFDVLRSIVQMFSCVCYFFSCYCYFRVSFQISKMRNETSSLLISRCYLVISCDKSSKNQIAFISNCKHRKKILLLEEKELNLFHILELHSTIFQHLHILQTYLQLLASEMFT